MEQLYKGKNSARNEQKFTKPQKILPDFYIVETILDKKRIANVTKYKIKWKGYGYAETTWEPEENLSNVQYLLDEFNNNNPYKKKVICNSKDKFAAIKNINEPQNSEDLKKITLKKVFNDENEAALDNSLILSPPNKKIKKNEVYEEEEEEEEEANYETGDIPLKILNARMKHDYTDEIILSIEWQTRENGEKPKNSYVSNKIFRKINPDLLLDFYESKIKFKCRLEKMNN